jgi:hypothetical protein
LKCETELLAKSEAELHESQGSTILCAGCAALKKCNFAIQKDIHLKEVLECKVKKEKPEALCQHFTLYDNGVANSF